MRYFFEVVEKEPVPEYDSDFEAGDVEEEMAVVVYGHTVVDPWAVTVSILASLNVASRNIAHTDLASPHIDCISCNAYFATVSLPYK